jgi:Asp-tRNA(Asn)/Glu-tRNA(Gln) amidotransferase A subunit family amidase
MKQVMDELYFLGIADAAKLIKARKLSPVDLVESLLHRIANIDPQINAFITVTGDLAREQAKKAEQEIARDNYRGPLHGIPYALKDIYNTRGILTTGHSKVCINNVPDRDASSTIALRNAGAILIGKLATHEFAHGGPSFDLPWPPARNPWRLDHFSGGSSSGSAAALAAGMVPAALGTDTGGSIRGPSSLCGVVGLKPTYGLVSRAGVMTNSFTFDHCGPMARSVEDCTLILQAIAGYDAQDPASVDLEIPNYRTALSEDVRGLRVGVARHFWEQDVPAHPDVVQAMEDAVNVFKHLGAHVEDCRLPPVAESVDVKMIIGESEIFSVHSDSLRKRPGDFGRDFLGRILPACIFSAADYVDACRERRRILANMATLYEKYDVLLTQGLGPATRLDAYRTESAWLNMNPFTPFSVAAGPALVVRCGFAKTGLPLGIQLAGRPFGEETVLKAGFAFEQAVRCHSTWPSIEAAAPAPIASIQNELSIPDSKLDAKTRSFVMESALKAGLHLNERQTAILLETAPHAIATASRLRRGRDAPEQHSLIFKH